MYTVVQRDVVENATVANVLQVSNMAGLSHWVKISPRTSAGRSKMVICLIVAGGREIMSPGFSGEDVTAL
jgi:hypothetical protein